jgi:hypothetical protein
LGPFLLDILDSQVNATSEVKALGSSYFAYLAMEAFNGCSSAMSLLEGLRIISYFLGASSYKFGVENSADFKWCPIQHLVDKIECLTN